MSGRKVDVSGAIADATRAIESAYGIGQADDLVEAHKLVTELFSAALWVAASWEIAVRTGTPLLADSPNLARLKDVLAQIRGDA